MHTKIEGYRPFNSGEEDFFRLLPHMGMAAIIWASKLSFPYPVEAVYEILL